MLLLWKMFSGGQVSMRALSRLPKYLICSLVLSLCFVGCGGGTSSNDISPATGKVLRWNPPQTFADQTPLDPAKDLKDYSIYVNETGNFTPADSPTAIVSAVDPTNGTLITSFNLANLGPFLSASKTYFVSMQSVSNTGVKSDFSPAASFSL